MSSASHETVTREPGSSGGARRLLDPVAEHTARGRFDVVLVVHPEVDDFLDRSLEARTAVGNGAVERAELDALGLTRNAQGVAGRHACRTGRRPAPRRTAHDAYPPTSSPTVSSSAFSEPMKSAGCLRVLVDVARWPICSAPAVHHGDPVRHGQCLFLVVRDVDEGRPKIGLDPLQLQLHVLAQLHVQRAERLVEQ